MCQGSLRLIVFRDGTHQTRGRTDNGYSSFTFPSDYMPALLAQPPSNKIEQKARNGSCRGGQREVRSESARVLWTKVGSVALVNLQQEHRATWASALRNSLSEHETTLLDSINKSRVYLGLPIKRPKRGARAPCIVTNTGTSGNNGPRLHESALQRTPGKPHRVASDAMNETP